MPSQNGTRDACASQGVEVAAASVAPSTASPSVATHPRKTAPGIRRPQCCTTRKSSPGHSTAASVSSAAARVVQPSSEKRVPSTVVAATAVSAPGVPARVTHCARSTSSR